MIPGLKRWLVQFVLLVVQALTFRTHNKFCFSIISLISLSISVPAQDPE
jgi:hypothetical protein